MAEAASTAVLTKDFIVDMAEVSACAAAVSRGQGGLVNLVTELGGVLNHSEVAKRRVGVEFLSGVIARTEAGSIGSQELHFLVRFFVDRLKDSVVLHPAVAAGFHGLLVSHGHNADHEDVVLALGSLLSQMQPQSFPSNDRGLVMEVLIWSLSDIDRRNRIRNSDFGWHFVTGFMQVVEGETNPRNLRLIFSCWPIIIAEFEVVNLYEDIFEMLACYFPVDFAGSAQVSKEELSNSLLECFRATPDFADFAFPLFMEKLSSDLTEAKIEALSWAVKCAFCYRAKLNSHVRDIWNSCKQEIMGIRANTNEQVIALAYDLLAEVTRQLCGDPTVQVWLNLVWDDLKNFLRFLESSLMETAVQILTRISASAGADSNLLPDRSIPVLLQSFEKTEDKASVVHMMGQLVSVWRSDGASPEWESAFADLAVKACLQQDAALRDSGLRALSAAAKRMGSASLNDALVQQFSLFVDGDDGVECQRARELAVSTFQARPDFVRSWILSLPSRSSWSLRLCHVVSALSATSSDILTTLLDKILLVLEAEGVSADGKQQLLSGLTAGLTAFPEEVEKLAVQHGLVQRLFNAKVEEECATQCEDLLSKLSAAARSDQFGGVLNEVGTHFVAEVDVDEWHNKMAAAVLSSARPDVLRKCGISETLLAAKPRSRLLKVIGSFMNKSVTSPDDNFLHNLTGHGISVAWIVKGLIMSGQDARGLVQHHIDRFINGLDSVEEFLTVVADDRLFSIDTHHRVLPFYKQKFFHSSFPALVSAFRDGSASHAVLDAILRQIPNIPLAVIESDIAPLLPLMAKALFSQKTTTFTPAMATFLELSRRLPVGDSGPASTMAEWAIPFLLDMALNDEVSIGDAVAALNAVERSYLPDMDSVKLPKELRQLVIAKTGLLLDHRKRLIRSAAASSRNVWMNY